MINIEFNEERAAYEKEYVKDVIREMVEAIAKFRINEDGITDCLEKTQYFKNMEHDICDIVHEGLWNF